MTADPDGQWTHVVVDGDGAHTDKREQASVATSFPGNFLRTGSQHAMAK